MYRKILRFAVQCCKLLPVLLGDDGRGRCEPPAAALLLRRYGQLDRLHSSYNRIVHATFYVSVVFVGILLGATQHFLGTLRGAMFFLFASGVFFAMLLWTRTSVNGRRSVTDQKAAVREALEAADFESVSGVAIDDCFGGDESRDFCDSRAWLKDGLLLSYYLLLILTTAGVGLYSLWTLV